MACDSTGNVYVANKFNHSNQVFAAEGGSLQSIASGGSGQLRDINFASVSIDSDSVVYILCDLDEQSSCFSIHLHTCEGKFLTSKKWTRIIKIPSGVAVDKNGLVYISAIQ